MIEAVYWNRWRRRDRKEMSSDLLIINLENTIRNKKPISNTWNGGGQSSLHRRRFRNSQWRQMNNASKGLQALVALAKLLKHEKHSSNFLLLLFSGEENWNFGVPYYFVKNQRIELSTVNSMINNWTWWKNEWRGKTLAINGVGPAPSLLPAFGLVNGWLVFFEKLVNFWIRWGGASAFLIQPLFYLQDYLFYTFLPTASDLSSSRMILDLINYERYLFVVKIHWSIGRSSLDSEPK